MAAIARTDAGSYSVRISNSFGTATSVGALLTVQPVCFTIGLYAGLTIEGSPGQTYAIRYVPELRETNDWWTLTNVVLTSPQTLWIDTESLGQLRRFYNVVPLP